ncbi:DUF2513 domain-containing protein [Ruegeria sp. WL0004]|uniref:DUF2513 domain-containing protein n=1 Tax=Ruegeria marisflavi TaxID=2984152 RepID=A0ABT2WVB9_9RHOB|nr:DUF2513 domain-containing protein [Ruegeria sp. WL0004]MCU9839856.1 DUF2513 domain-containing protein [Ruegeria sp. WL0004]
MKRDLDLIREILLEVEAKSDGRSMVYEYNNLSVEKRHHIDLLLGANLLNEVGAVRSSAKKKVHLSWEGHDYLGAIRDKGVWEQTKKAVSETGGSATLEIFKSLAVGFAKKKISQHTGIDI